MSRVALLAAVTVAAGSLALLGCSSSELEVEVGAPATSGTPPASQAPPASSIYKVFGDAGQQPVPGAARTRAESSQRRVQPNPARTRLLASAGDVSVFGLTDDRSVCLYMEKTTRNGERSLGSAGCAPLDSADIRTKPLISTVYLGGDRYQLSALVPDGIDSVTLTTEAGTKTYAIANNALTTELASKPRSVTWGTAPGDTRSAEPWSDG